MKWIDTFDIALALVEKFPDQDPRQVNFVDLRDWVMSLEAFDDAPNRCGEKILEAIQAAWIDEIRCLISNGSAVTEQCVILRCILGA
mgnify:CR=1 FL=1